MKNLIRLAVTTVVAGSTVVMLPGAHGTVTGAGCVAIPNPMPAPDVEVVGSCEFTSEGTSTSFRATAGHWQVLVNGKVAASGFGALDGEVPTEPDDHVEALIYPGCTDDTCSATGVVVLVDDNAEGDDAPAGS